MISLSNFRSNLNNSIKDNINLQSSIQPHTYRAELILEASLIIWEELAAANIAAMNCVDELCRRLQNKWHLPFGRIPFLGLGDFRQVAPVAHDEGVTPLLLASVKSSPIWCYFRIFTLYGPHRSAEDIKYTNFVDKIGEDYLHREAALDVLHRVRSDEEASAFLFPLAILSNSISCLKRTRLSPINSYVDDFNDRILANVQETMSTFLHFILRDML